MTRTSLDDALWASLMLTMQQLPRAWKRDETVLRRFVEAALWIGRTGAPWRDLPDGLGRWPSVYHRFRRWSVRGWWNLVFEAHRAASGAARSDAQAACLGRSRGGLCSKLHVCADGAGRILRLVPSPGSHVWHSRARRHPRARLCLGPAARRVCSRRLRRPHPAKAWHGGPAALGQDDLRPPSPCRDPVPAAERLWTHRVPT